MTREDELNTLTREQLRQMIEDELNKPAEAVDEALVARCDDLLAGPEYRADEAMKARIWQNLKRRMAEDAPRRRSGLRRRPMFVAAACLLALLLAATVCLAMGILPWKLSLDWDDERLSLVITQVASEESLPPQADAPVGMGRGDAFDEKLKEAGFAVALPQWLPEDVRGEPIVDEALSDGRIWTVVAGYKSSRGYITFDVTNEQAIIGDGISNLDIEKDEEPMDIVERDGQTYYIMSNLGDTVIFWMRFPYTVIVGGYFDREEARRMIDSIPTTGGNVQ